MDAKRFDRLAHDINHVGSRRGALRLLGGGALAGAVALLGGEETSARCRPRSRRCGQGNCCPKGQMCGDRATQTCVTGRGTCGAKENSCRASLATCDNNGNCFCLKTQKGETRCAIPVAGTCGTCETDADCPASIYGVGAFCASKTATNCCISDEEGLCASPCPS